MHSVYEVNLTAIKKLKLPGSPWFNLFDMLTVAMSKFICVARANMTVSQNRSQSLSVKDPLFYMTSFEVRKNVMQISWLHIQCAAS